jgi:hypothetical protein
MMSIQLQTGNSLRLTRQGWLLANCKKKDFLGASALWFEWETVQRTVEGDKERCFGLCRSFIVGSTVHTVSLIDLLMESFRWRALTHLARFKHKG